MQASPEAAGPDGEASGSHDGIKTATSLNRISVSLLDYGDSSRYTDLAEVVRRS